MKAAIYIRVSTEEQSEENQLPVLKSWAESRGYEIAEVYTDIGSAWQHSDQKELRRLIDDARLGRFGIALVWSLDRLTRGGIGKIFSILDNLAEYKVRVISHQESWTDTPSELQPLLFSVYAWVAQQESKRISERTKLGMERARAQGKHIGRPRKEKVTISDDDKKARVKLDSLKRRAEYLTRQIKELEPEKGDKKQL